MKMQLVHHQKLVKLAIDVIKELHDFDIDGFILEKCHYPDSGNTDGATYPGERKFKNKNGSLIKQKRNF